MPPIRLPSLLVHAAILLVHSSLPAQNLPPPSRTIYKCSAQGTTSYSDKPCLGATRMEVSPTRGVSKLTGSERTGRDVSNERQHEAFSEALRPLSGMDAQQFALFSKRLPLAQATRHECEELDRSMLAAERDERSVPPAQAQEVKERLYLMRRRFGELRC